MDELTVTIVIKEDEYLLQCPFLSTAIIASACINSLKPDSATDPKINLYKGKTSYAVVADKELDLGKIIAVLEIHGIHTNDEKGDNNE